MARATERITLQQKKKKLKWMLSHALNIERASCNVKPFRLFFFFASGFDLHHIFYYYSSGY